MEKMKREKQPDILNIIANDHAFAADLKTAPAGEQYYMARIMPDDTIVKTVFRCRLGNCYCGVKK